jgi:hypothetical protein
MSMKNVEPPAPQQSRESQDSDHSGNRIDPAVHVDVHNWQMRAGEPFKQRSFLPQTSNRHAIAGGIQPPRQFHGLGLGSAQHEGIDEEEDAPRPLASVLPRLLRASIHFSSMQADSVTCLHHRRNLLKGWDMGCNRLIYILLWKRDQELRRD